MKKRLLKIAAALDREMREEQQLAKDLLRTLSQEDRAKIAADMLPVYEATAARVNDMVQFFRALKAGATGAA